MDSKTLKAMIYAATLNAYLIAGKKDSFALTKKDYEIIEISVKMSLKKYYEMVE